MVLSQHKLLSSDVKFNSENSEQAMYSYSILNYQDVAGLLTSEINALFSYIMWAVKYTQS